MLKKQHFEILKIIENERKLSKVAELLNLTERSVRYKIDEINEELGSKKIEIKKREFFSSMTENDMDKLFENIEESNYIYSQKEREELIILYTLMKKDNFLLKELADKLNITRNTLTNWEKEKPELIRLINQGLALDEQILETQKFLEKLEKIKEKANNGKINIKETK